ncbi:MAG: molybdopterin-dependent oxidoreductase [Sedimentisphaerales bacterium]|nr:molybdopterin-dependent oxidoreductase [Sedimentisphaerales bacterium]
MKQTKQAAEPNRRRSHRYLYALGAALVIPAGIGALQAGADEGQALLKEAISHLQYLTMANDFITYGRGDPPPDQLAPEKKREVGLMRETWRLEVVADSESNSKLDNPLTREAGTALDWEGLMKLAETKAVRFMTVLTCTNGNMPLGMGLWEGVPLKDVIWLARPQENVRRVYYYGYHNDDPKQRFQSSLPIGRVLEEPPGEYPVILCYKLNGEWLTSKRGGPVRMLVPGQYGNKSVKWLQRIVLTNDYKANDTYATWNNDTVSQIKTCARFIETPKKIQAGKPAPITGVAQVGMGGLSKVQYLVCRKDTPASEDDPYFIRAAWQDADILPAPTHWGGGLPDGKLPSIPGQIDPKTGRPYRWPMRYTVAYWAALLKIDKPGQYDLRCRTVDENGIAQPMPRPFLKSGKNDIQKVQVIVEQ